MSVGERVWEIGGEWVWERERESECGRERMWEIAREWVWEIESECGR